jgi:putative aldouronate transport system permease protein
VMCSTGALSLIFLNSQTLYPLQLIIRQLSVLTELPPATLATLSPQELTQIQDCQTLVQYALIIVGSLPMLAL